MYILLQEHVAFINPTSILSIIVFIQRKSSYKEYYALIQPLFPLKRDYFHQNKIHLEIIHCILAKGKSSFHLSYIMIFSSIQLPLALYRNGRRPKGRRPEVTYPRSLEAVETATVRLLLRLLCQKKCRLGYRYNAL